MFYSLYGFVVHSEAPLPGLVPSSSEPVDLRVMWGAMPLWLDPALETAEVRYVSAFLDEEGKPRLTIWKLNDGQYFRLAYADGVEFVLDAAGANLWARWPDAMAPEDAATYLLGPVMGFVLLLRGVFSLHASAIAVDGRAIALIGEAGAGKSTTAAAFARMGYGVMAEDVVALDDCGQTFFVQPGYPLIRLWPESVSMLFGTADALPLLTPNWTKRYLDLTQEGYYFQAKPLPLAAIYILGNRRDDPSAPYVEPVAANKGLINLIANMYATYLMDSSMRGREFEMLGRMCESVAIRRVVPHADSARLSALCETILADFQMVTSSGAGRG